MSDLLRRLAVATAGMTVVAAAVWSAYGLTGLEDGGGPGEAVTLYDPRDARQVAGTADDVFTGTVVGHGGERDVYGVLSDLYAVRVGRVLKGQLRGTVDVSYEQGREPLPAGSSYVFATGRVPDGGSNAVLLETIPDPVGGPGGPGGPADASATVSAQAVSAQAVSALAATVGRTVAEHWAWAVRHEIDVSPL
ncbi:hypothetical protein [Streptomyces sp. Je 1-369]|uniref:hypothetical protein n=1 Tax=Streptomyces sp. Je 1-369 TaxID=2966192 RepID=UPI002285974C|nr:hypothetical protein [Streptomyces sp. Je 1-369]WAL99822.1 hypothetical protein NOO62_38345 [Streptomyces sp. Je 1-369]